MLQSQWYGSVGIDLGCNVIELIAEFLWVGSASLFELILQRFDGLLQLPRGRHMRIYADCARNRINQGDLVADLPQHRERHLKECGLSSGCSQTDAASTESN